MQNHLRNSRNNTLSLLTSANQLTQIGGFTLRGSYFLTAHQELIQFMDNGERKLVKSRGRKKTTYGLDVCLADGSKATQTFTLAQIQRQIDSQGGRTACMQFALDLDAPTATDNGAHTTNLQTARFA